MAIEEGYHSSYRFLADIYASCQVTSSRKTDRSAGPVGWRLLGSDVEAFLCVESYGSWWYWHIT